jgi:hypothetical protein
LPSALPTPSNAKRHAATQAGAQVGPRPGGRRAAQARRSVGGHVGYVGSQFQAVSFCKVSGVGHVGYVGSQFQAVSFATVYILGFTLLALYVGDK